MKVAALDLGSNTFLLLVAEISGGQVAKVYRDETDVVRLGKGLGQSGLISDESLKRADACLKRFRQILDLEKPQVVIAVATSAARDAKNREAFEKIASRHGFQVRTVTGSEEAEITYRGATFDFGGAHNAVIDVGGGSTEVIGKGESGKLVGLSVNVGSVRLTDQFFPIQPPSFEQVQKLQKYAVSQFQAVGPSLPRGAKTAIAVAGTPTALACLEMGQAFEESRVHKSRLNTDNLQSWILKLFPLPLAERERVPGMPANRSDVLVAGTCILAAALSALHLTEIFVSTKGVRYGLALEWESLK